MKKKKSAKKLRYIFIGILTSVIIFLIFGIVMALIPNNFFVRMFPPTIIDYIFLFSTSVMLGAYFSLYFYGKQEVYGKEDYAAAGGALPSILAFSCPLCNALLVSLLGAATILAFIEPLRPVFGIFGIGILGFALYLKVKNLKSCRRCSKK